MKCSKKFLFFLLANFFFLLSLAQDECREANATEKTAIDKLRSVAREQLIPVIKKNGWSIELEIADEKIAAKPVPYRPMMLCGSIYTLKLNVEPSPKLAHDPGRFCCLFPKTNRKSPL